MEDDEDIEPVLEYDEQGIPFEVMDLPEDDFWAEDDDYEEDRLAA